MAWINYMGQNYLREIENMMRHRRVCKQLESKCENVPSDISLIIHVNKHTDNEVSIVC